MRTGCRAGDASARRTHPDLVPDLDRPPVVADDPERVSRAVAGLGLVVDCFFSSETDTPPSPLRPGEGNYLDPGVVVVVAPAAEVEIQSTLSVQGDGPLDPAICRKTDPGGGPDRPETIR